MQMKESIKKLKKLITLSGDFIFFNNLNLEKSKITIIFVTEKEIVTLKIKQI